MEKVWMLFFLVCNSGSHLTSAVYVRSPEEVVVGNGTTDTEPVLNQQSGGALMQKEPPPDPVCGVPAIKPKVPECPRIPSDGLGIVNGEDAEPHSWPWQVSLQRRVWSSYHFCGGSLINENWVVTAAHCGVSEFFHHVILGLHNRKDTNNVQRMKIGKVFNHPDYSGKPHYDYDIALIKLESPAQMNEYVSPVCVAETCDKFNDYMECVATGWGDTSYKAAPRSPDTLQQVCLRLISDRGMCNSYWEQSPITRLMICAGSEGAATCLGDSGGPLVCEKDGIWTLVGVTSWGKKGCPTNMPGVYSRISALRDWMDEIMEHN